MSLVVDASTALASVLPDEGSEYARTAISAALTEGHGLTSYDAAYLVVALGTGARLATGDKRLRSLAMKIGIEIFGGYESATSKRSPK